MRPRKRTRSPVNDPKKAELALARLARLLVYTDRRRPPRVKTTVGVSRAYRYASSERLPVFGLSDGTAIFAGVALILSGTLLAGLLFTQPPAGGCTEVGVEPSADTGFALRGFESGHVVYTPDGANECQLAAPLVGLPVLGFVGGVVLGFHSRSGYGRPVGGRGAD